MSEHIRRNGTSKRHKTTCYALTILFVGALSLMFRVLMFGVLMCRVVMFGMFINVGLTCGIFMFRGLVVWDQVWMHGGFEKFLYRNSCLGF